MRSYGVLQSHSCALLLVFVIEMLSVNVRKIFYKQKRAKCGSYGQCCYWLPVKSSAQPKVTVSFKIKVTPYDRVKP